MVLHQQRYAVETIDKESNEIPGEREPASPIILFDRFLDSLGVTRSTGWRWRTKNWVKTLNLAGRVYIARAEINRFAQRAAAGEFSQLHKTPGRKARSRRADTVQ